MKIFRLMASIIFLIFLIKLSRSQENFYKVPSPSSIRCENGKTWDGNGEICVDCPEGKIGDGNGGCVVCKDGMEPNLLRDKCIPCKEGYVSSTPETRSKNAFSNVDVPPGVCYPCSVDDDAGGSIVGRGRRPSSGIANWCRCEMGKIMQKNCTEGVKCPCVF